MPVVQQSGLSPRLDRLRNLLIDTAKRKDVIPYNRVAQFLGIVTDRLGHCAELTQALDEISTSEHRHNRPLLSVVAVHENDKRPGAGFFKMARRNEVQAPGEDDETFFVAELRRAHDYWR